MTSVPVYCLCQLPYDITRFMIECDLCQQWFHGSCVGVEEEKAEDIDIYHCPTCEILHGPSIMKSYQGTPMAQGLTDNTEVAKMLQTGSPEFIQELQQRTFHSNKKVKDLTRSRNSKAKLKVRTKAQPKLITDEKFDLDSKEELKIEETPQKEKAVTTKKKLPKFRRKLLRAIPCSDRNRILEPGEVYFDMKENYTADKNVEEGVEAKVESTGGACGILDLLKASNGGPDCAGHDKAPASPRTLEAIQALLYMANLPPVSPLPPVSSFQAWWASEEYSGGSGSTSEKGGGPPASQGTMKEQAVKQLANHSTESEKGEVNTCKPENLRNSFKDEEDTVYLESDEDDCVSKLRPKKKKKKSVDDAAWIPKARVVPSLPKRAWPVRERTIVSSVETTLTGTVAKLAQQEPFSGSLSDHGYSAQPKISGMAQVNQRMTSIALGVFLSQEHPSVSSHGNQMAQGKQPKKGLATAKQHLGHISKIHRKGKLLL